MSRSTFVNFELLTVRFWGRVGGYVTPCILQDMLLLQGKIFLMGGGLDSKLWSQPLKHKISN